MAYANPDPYQYWNPDRDDLSPSTLARYGGWMGASREPQLWDYSTGQMQTEGSRADAYRMAAYGQYDPILAGQGGYRPDEATNIIREQQYNALPMTPEEAQANYYTPYEQAAIKGRPGGDYFQPGAQYDIVNQAGTERRDAANTTEDVLRQAVDPSALRMQDYVTPQARQSAQQMASATNAAIDPSRLGISSQYATGMPMSDQEKQDIITGAGITTQNAYKAAADRIDREAAAAGTGAPGEAAMRMRLARYGSQDAADAMTQARLGASAQAAGRLQQYEGTRLGAEQYLSGAQTGAARDINEANYRAIMEPEQMRLGAEQYLSGAQVGTGEYMGGLRQNVASTNEASQLGNVKDIRDYGNTMEQTEAGRNLTLANQRTGTAAYNQATRYGQGMGVNQQIGQGYQTVGNARRSDEAEARGWLTGQGQQSQQAQLGWGQQRIQGMQAAGQQVNQAAGTLADYDIGRRNSKNWYQRNVSPIVKDVSSLG